MRTHFLIGAANSGAGKTTVTIGLLRVLRDRGLRVQPFKCGPDYIDTKYHAAAALAEPVNLDVWLASESHVRRIYRDYAAKADCCVTEGVMGLFDGYRKMEGSSAAIAALLDIPVILIVNAASSAYSVAPMIYGFARFNPKVRVAGVIFNKVSSESHFSFLREACADVGTECFGYLPDNKEITIPSRHLGLTIGRSDEMERYISKIAEMIEGHVDVDRIIECLSADDGGITPDEGINDGGGSGTTFAVAYDEAFNFTYRENIESLRRSGKVVFFSPLHDTKLPDADLIYLPGGYPEIYSEGLNANLEMRRAVKAFADNGGRIFAECGGMMYLGRSLRYNDNTYEMCGVLPIDSTMENARLTLGYRYMTYNGRKYRGHEFHYSHTVNPGILPSVAQLYNARGMEVPVPLYRMGGVIAGYTHWYWGEGDLLDFWK